MPGSPRLKFEVELRQLARDVCRDGLPLPHRPQATMALAVAVSDQLSDTATETRAANAAALAVRVFDATMLRVPPAKLGGDVACKSGCTYCCHNTVMATAPEIFLAARELRATRDPQSVSLVAGACDAVLTTAGTRKTPCPLLHEALCSVYAARPIVCRKHTSFDVGACLADYEGKGGNIPIRRLDQEIFECCAVALIIGMRLWDGREGAVHDLAGALRVALLEPEAEQRWLAGNDIFAGVTSQEKLPGITEHAAFLWDRFMDTSG